MNKTYNKVKDLKNQIAASEEELNNVKNWNSLFCRQSEKRKEMISLQIKIGSLKKLLLDTLDDLEWEIQEERKNLQNAAINISQQQQGAIAKS